ncbi:acyl carrier protein [Gordonia sp. VNK21]|uniref:acyl carrier protein n=1 Tax=Gordonia sp. VNK21 TaxID=3382483 RepID=UPI0038D45E76
MNKDMLDQVFGCAAESFGPPHGRTDAASVTSLEEVFAVNSMKLIDFVDRVEQRFGIELPATKLTSENVLNVPNLLALIDFARGRCDA